MYWTSGSIQFANQYLAANHSYVDYIALEDSHEGRPISALHIHAGSAKGRRAVVFVGGTHAREVMNPNLLVELVLSLLTSYQNNSDIVLGKRVWPANHVKTYMEALDIIILPNVNPDGREAVLGGDTMWRKNRRQLQGTSCIGVDLNRNYDLLHGIETYHPSYGTTTSSSPCSDLYFGPGAFSEPETRNVKKLLDDYDVDCLVDVHSYSELVLHPWGHAHTQTTDPTQRFTLVDTSGWNVLPNDAPGFEEYMPPQDLERFQKVGQAAADAIHDVRGRTYVVEPGTDLYETTGTTSDYTYSRHVADSELRKTYGFTFETGPWKGSGQASFQPPFPEAQNIIEEGMSGLISILQSCTCAIHLIGWSLFGSRAADTLTAMRAVRDDRLLTTEEGSTWAEVLERHQPELAVCSGSDDAFRHAAGEVFTTVAEMLSREKLDKKRMKRIRELLAELSACESSSELRGDLRRLSMVSRRLQGMHLDEAVSLASEIAYSDPEAITVGRLSE